MAARLVTLGDSLTQGFQHGAIRRTDWAFPAMLARALGAQTFRRPHFDAGNSSMVLDLELLLDRLSLHCGTHVDLWEAPKALYTLERTMAGVEEYWERRAGAQPADSGPIHHNLATWGCEVLDALTLSDAVCADNTPRPRNNLIDQLPEHAMYRSTRRTLNPAALPELRELTALGLAQRLAEQEGIENLLVGLGANNALGPCATLKVRRSSPADLSRLAHERSCNLWEPEHFAAAYAELAAQLEAIPAQRVFLTTVPHVTIAPVTRGVSPHARAAAKPEQIAGYFEYYTRFWIWDQSFDPKRNSWLAREEAQQIDACIDAYNQSIRSEAQKRGWHVVDLCRVLDDLAFRRHGGKPPYRLPAGLVDALRSDPRTRFRVRPDGQVLLDTRYFRIPAHAPSADATTEAWQMAFKGGIFGLDGVHPSTVGYGIIAHEVLKEFQNAGVPGADPSKLHWPDIVAADGLLCAPPALLVSLEATLGALFATLPLDHLIDKLAGDGAKALLR